MWMLATLFACGTEQPQVEAPEVEEVASGPIVIYSGRSESLVGPLFESIASETGLELDVQYGSTPELVTRVLTEGPQSPADLVFAQDSGHMGVLAKRGALAPLPDALVKSVDPRFRSMGWVGTSGRLRTLVVDTEALPEGKRPASLKELAKPKWKGKVGWAPGNGSFQAHVSALRHAWGEEETKAWLQGMIANEPRVYPKNSPQVAAANTGEIAVGWVNHYYLHRVEKEGRRAANHAFGEEGKAGNILMVSGIGVRKGSPHEAEAHKVIAALLSESSQQYFAKETFEYPTVPGIPTHPDVRPLASVPLHDVNQEHLADLAPTRKLLEELGLL